MTIPSSGIVKGIIVLDTSVILHDPNSIFGFEGYDIIIPMVVLGEVDKFRPLDNEIGRNARSFIRSLNDLLTEGGKFSKGVTRKETGEKIFVRVLNNTGVFNGSTLDSNKNDDIILAACIEIVNSNKDKQVSLATKDISLSVKANTLDIRCFDYHADVQVQDASQLYTGMFDLPVPSSVVDDLYSKGKLTLDSIDCSYTKFFKVFENAGVTLVDESCESHTALCTYHNESFRRLSYDGSSICNITPKNREQVVAFDLILDPKVKLVTLTGAAGTGKTLCAIASGIHMAMNKNMYDRVVVSRPIQPLGNDLGYLPGGIEEKLHPWMAPIRDAVEFIFGGDRHKFEDMLYQGFIEIEPLTYIRGRSLPRTLFIVDEAQNTSRHEMKTIISRIGKDSKIILTGDVFQIDNHYLDTYTNGLTSVVEKFKDSSLAGHVTLAKGQRSDLATLAAKLL
jgi:PhoH-like ATPase